MNEWYDYEYKSNPKVGETVYLVFNNEIYKTKIYAVGEDFFIPKGYQGYVSILREIKFSDYGERWFHQLSTAKDKIIECLTDEEEIVEGAEDWWYVSQI